MAPANAEPSARRHFYQLKSPTYSEVVAGTHSNTEYNSILNNYKEIEDGFERQIQNHRYIKTLYQEFEQGNSSLGVDELVKLMSNLDNGIKDLSGGMHYVREDISSLNDNVNNLT